MKRLLLLTCVVSVAITPSVVSALPMPLLKWTQTPSGSSVYYLNGNVDDGAALAGQINFGARRVDGDGVELNALNTTGLLPHTGAKCLVRIGDYYYITDSSGGIGRFDATGTNAWSGASWAPTPAPGVVNPGTNPESLVTDGTWLFANDDGAEDRIHAYSINNSATSFSLTEQWEADLDGNPAVVDGRVRGLSYDAGSGYLYMHNGGAGASDTTLYAIDASDGTVYNMGTHIEGDRTYQVLRYGDELLVVGLTGNLTVYDLVDDTTIVAGPKQQFNLGLGNLYGVTIVDSTLFVSGPSNRLSGFVMIPEPGTLVLLGLGGLLLVLTRSRRRRK